MEFIYINPNQLRPKAAEKIRAYLALSEHNRLTIGLCKKGRCYIIGRPEENRLLYDIGSVTKTITAHLILKLHEENKLDIYKTADNYLPLKKGKYPTLYQLLTHTAGYHHLTPIEVTLPSLVRHGYARKNPYENCTVKTVVHCLHRRRFITPQVRYGYSDFASAILAAVAETVTKTPFPMLLEDFIHHDLGLKETHIAVCSQQRNPPAVKGKKRLPFWVWKRNNPYIAGGGIVSSIGDVLKYLTLQMESDAPFIRAAHTVCEHSMIKNDNHMMCIGWHTYQRSNQLWHVGGVGTFRTSVIFNKQSGIAVAVLGNAKGTASANAHYIAKMLYSELKNNRIRLEPKGADHDLHHPPD
jgi:CubicO group peptidase (beta-lactamase class C family)